MDASLRKRYGPGSAIILRKGPYLEALKDVAVKAHATAVHYSRRQAISFCHGYLPSKHGLEACIVFPGTSLPCSRQTKLFTRAWRQRASQPSATRATCCTNRRMSRRARLAGFAGHAMSKVEPDVRRLQIDMSKWKGHAHLASWSSLLCSIPAY